MPLRMLGAVFDGCHQEELFGALKLYHEEHATFVMEQHWPEDTVLLDWCRGLRPARLRITGATARSRRYLSPDLLSPERQRRLEAIGFDWRQGVK